MLILVIICLLSCERTLTSTTPSESDSTKVIQDSTSTNPNITTDTIPNTNQDTVTSTIPNPDTNTGINKDTVIDGNGNVYLYDSYDIYLNNQLDIIIKLEVFRMGELSIFNLIPNDTIYFTTIEYYEIEGVKYNMFPGDVEYDAYISSIDSINVFYNDKKYTYIKKLSHTKPFKQSDVEYFFRKSFDVVTINEEEKKYFGWE